MEIFAGNDVGGRHRPVFRDLDILLLEDGAPLRVGDRRGAQLPLELLIGRYSSLAEVATELETRRFPGRGRALRAGVYRHGCLVSYIGHKFLLRNASTPQMLAGFELRLRPQFKAEFGGSAPASLGWPPNPSAGPSGLPRDFAAQQLAVVPRIDCQRLRTKR